MVELVDCSENCSGRCWWTSVKLELVEFAGGDGSALCGGHLALVEWLEVDGSGIASQSKLSY